MLLLLIAHVSNLSAMSTIPVRPAPATPNKDPMIATPAVVPNAAAPAPPIMAEAPAATRGAANPPVSPNLNRN
jgi:hypothetical protein